METHRRRQVILTLLEERGEVAVDELAADLDVSQNTIRNDLNALADEALVRRVRGGAANRHEVRWLARSCRSRMAW